MHTAGHRPQNYVSRCFLRCRPPAPTETIGFPVRQQSGTKRCRKPQETIPTHPPESDDTKIRPFPRSDYKKTQVQRCTTRHPTRFWFKVGKSTGRFGKLVAPSSGRRVSESRLILSSPRFRERLRWLISLNTVGTLRNSLVADFQHASPWRNAPGALQRPPP